MRFLEQKQIIIIVRTVASLCPPLTLGSAHPEPKVPERSEALTVLHAGSGWGPRDSTGLEYGALLENRS